jgi:hypothetical protein
MTLSLKPFSCRSIVMYTILSIARQKTLHKYIRDVSAVCRVAKLLLKTVLLAVKVLRA